MDLRTHTHIYKTKKNSHLTSFLREERTSFYMSAKTIDHTVQSAEYQFLQFQSLIYTQSEQLNIRITHSHRYNSADLQIANKTIIEAFKTL